MEKLKPTKESMMSYIMGQISLSQKTKSRFCNRFGFGVEEIVALLQQCIKTILSISDVDVETKKATQQVAQWVIGSTKWGLLLCGTFGSGKTTLATAFTMLYKQLEGGLYPPKVVVISALDACHIARTDETKYLAICDKADLIVLDDVGTEPMQVKVFGTDTSPIVHMLYKRYDNRKPIIITSNLDVKSFYQRYGERVADRGKEMISIITLTNPSRRK